MKLSPITIMFAARGLGDQLAAAGVSTDVLALAQQDPNFLNTAAEQMIFRQGGHTFGRHRDGALLSLAVAHAVGRMTAAVHQLADDIEAAWPDLDAQHRDEITATIRAANEVGRLGMEIDAARWRDILALAEDEPTESLVPVPG